MMGLIKRLVTWFRFIVKQIDTMQSSYVWHQMSFHTKWTPSSTVVLCFDLSRPVQTGVQQVLSRRQRLDLTDMYAMHAIVLDEIVDLFDKSVRALRDKARRVEKVYIYQIDSPMTHRGLIRNARVEMPFLAGRQIFRCCMNLRGTLYILPKPSALR